MNCCSSVLKREAFPSQQQKAAGQHEKSQTRNFRYPAPTHCSLIHDLHIWVHPAHSLLYQAHLHQCFLSNPPITDQSMGNKHWTLPTPATPSIIYLYFPYILSFHSYFSCPEQHYILFSPQLIVIIYLCPFIQISSKYTSNLFSSPQSPPGSETSLSLLLGVSSLTWVQWVCNPGSNPLSQLRHPLFDLIFAVAHFFLPVASVNTIQLFLRLYLGPSNSLSAFLKDPLNFTPHLSELPASFLALSTPAALQQIFKCCY